MTAYLALVPLAALALAAGWKLVRWLVDPTPPKPPRSRLTMGDWDKDSE